MQKYINIRFFVPHSQHLSGHELNRLFNEEVESASITPPRPRPHMFSKIIFLLIFKYYRTCPLSFMWGGGGFFQIFKVGNAAHLPRRRKTTPMREMRKEVQCSMKNLLGLSVKSIQLSHLYVVDFGRAKRSCPAPAFLTHYHAIQGAARPRPSMLRCLFLHTVVKPARPWSNPGSQRKERGETGTYRRAC